MAHRSTKPCQLGLRPEGEGQSTTAWPRCCRVTAPWRHHWQWPVQNLLHGQVGHGAMTRNQRRAERRKWSCP